jgi:hypothetical protein
LEISRIIFLFALLPPPSLLFLFQHTQLYTILQVLKNGMNENWNIKNRFRETRLRVEGMGVHG